MELSIISLKHFTIIYTIIYTSCLASESSSEHRIQTLDSFNTHPQQNEDSDVEQGFDLSKDEMIKFKIWPQGNVPYYIDEFSYDKVLRDKIRFFLERTSAQTGLQFNELLSPPTSPQDNDDLRWVFIVNRRGELDCVDYNTRSFTNEGVQKLVIGYDCLNEGGGGLAAAILALVGVPPQHNAPNRDEYITVYNENIIPDKRHFFEVLSDKDWLFHDFEYDFESASHYGQFKYTSSGRLTIGQKRPSGIIMGEAEKFSRLDILKIKSLYSYISKKESKSKCTELFRPGKNFKNYKSKPREDKPLPKPTKYLNNAGLGSKPSAVPRKHPSNKKSVMTKQFKEKSKLSLMSDFNTSG